MPTPKRGSHRHGRSSGKVPGRRSSGTLRKRPSGREGSGKRRTEEEDEDLYAPGKNWTPHIIGGCIAGVILLIIILVLISNPPPDNGDTTGGNATAGDNEQEIERKANELTTEAERYASIYSRTRNAADMQRALDAIDKALAQWEILRKRYPNNTAIDHEMSQLNKRLSDIHKMPPLE
ncbi:MAG: hypothetical protein E3J72_13900 [Planctomycetota bacterium]|nr:MAG: hypothetical protein E3J72_13900 [Planctomycetota bacterium]